MVHDLPNGGKRLLRRAHGEVATIVSGVLVYRNGEMAGPCPIIWCAGRRRRRMFEQRDTGDVSEDAFIAAGEQAIAGILR